MLQMSADRAGEHPAFDVLADVFEIGRIVFVGNPLHILFNNRPLIKFGGGVMGRGSDHLHPALPGALVGIPPLKRGKEGVVNVDDPLRKLFDEVIGKNLHVTGQHHQVDPVPFQQIQHPLLLSRLSVRHHRAAVERITFWKN